MSDIVGRCFHRILAKQMEVSLPFNTRKKAFCAGDSIADSVWFIQAVIKHHQDGLRPLNVAFMDVKKAFDSVSHQSILVAALRVGVPPPFLGYIRELYSDAVTTLRIGQERSDPIKLGLWLTGVWGSLSMSMLYHRCSLSRVDASTDPVIAAMLSTVSASKGQAMQIWRTTLNGREMTSSHDVKVTMAEMLHRTVDGRGLALSSEVPECHRWVKMVCSGGTPNTARSYIAFTMVQGNLIGTALR